MAGFPTYLVSEEMIVDLIEHLRSSGMSILVDSPGEVLQPGEWYQAWTAVDAKGVRINITARINLDGAAGSEPVWLELDSPDGRCGRTALRSIIDYLMRNGAIERNPLRDG